MGSCKWCGDGFAINSTTGKCATSTITNCNKLERGLCLQCKPGYKLSSSRGACNVYCNVKSCNKCTNGPCTECKLGFTLITSIVNESTVQVCQQNNCSVANCTYCDQSNVCLQCKSGFYMNATDKTCYTNCTAITGCINCTSGSTTCNECVEGKSWNSTKKSCEVFSGTTNCKIHKTTCTTCRTGFTLTSSTKQCVQTC